MLYSGSDCGARCAGWQELSGQMVEMLIEYAESLRMEGTELMFDLMCTLKDVSCSTRVMAFGKTNRESGTGMMQYFHD